MAKINGEWNLAMPAWREAQWSGRWADAGHERPLVETMRRWIVGDALTGAVSAPKKPPVVYDVGAECGDLSALWAVWGARVVLVEPMRAQWPNIRAHFELNDVAERVAGCFVGFASNEDGGWGAEFVAGPWPRATHGPLVEDPGFAVMPPGEVTQPHVSIDTLAATVGERPNIVTIDVEGAEMHVIAGMYHVLTEVRPRVHVAVHPDPMRDVFITGPDQLAEMFGDYGYVVETVTDHEWHWFCTPEELA